MSIVLPARTAVCAVVFLCAGACLPPAVGDDWPAYRHDIGRTGGTAERLHPALHLQWTYVSRHAPRPAWPEPIREVNLLGFDQAYQIVAAEGLVYFGSSADHQVYALDLATGRERWRFFTDAPVRFAPQVDHGKVYVAGDDGQLYCLSAADGTLLWRFRGGPADERLLGNGAMMSRWPLRGGLVVDGGTVYFTAGMWPSEGVYAYALKAADGVVLWKTDSAGNFAPQGYMAANENLIFALAGRADGKRIERATGKVLDGKGMSQAIVLNDLYLTGPFTHGANENLPTRGGLPLAERSRRISAWKLDGKKPFAELGGKDLAAIGNETVYVAGPGKIACHALPRMEKKWEIASAGVYSLAVVGPMLACGGENTVALLDASTGQKLWSAEVEGRACGLAVASGRLLASTHLGHIACFGADKPAEAGRTVAAASSASGEPASSARAAEILRSTNVTAGFCLLSGVGDGRLALDLARQSKLTIYCAEADEGRVAAARGLLHGAGLYGTRVTVHHVPSNTLPYPNYFADLVVVDAPTLGNPHYSAGELRRVLRPCGGTAFLAAVEGQAAPELRLDGTELTETRLSPKVRKVVRGKLPGAGEWTHQYADPGNSASSGDQLVRWPLRILWFGEPGPQRMMNRHWRGTAPLSLDGRMFILGQHSLMAFDAYNGRELWSRELPSIARRAVDTWGGSMAADAESLYVANAEMCLRLDVATGDLKQLYQLPLARPRFSLASPQTFELRDLGKVEVCHAPDALRLTLTTSDTAVTNADPGAGPAAGDSWELFFDFRPEQQRSGFYGPGAFQLIVVPATKEKAEASSHRGPWSEPPPAQVLGTLDAKGSQTTVRLAWADIERLTGSRPIDFRFGVVLNSSDNGKQLTRRTYRYANDASYRLANCWATMTADEGQPGREPQAQGLLDLGEAERLSWGNLAVHGDVVLGTIGALKESPFVLARGWDFASEGHDYTGPTTQQVLDMIGVQGGAEHVFALGKNDGRVRWTYKPAGVVSGNGVAVGGGRVYLLDGPYTAKDERLRRRGQPVAQKPSLVALDLATGKQLWRMDQGLEDCDALRLGHGVLLATHLKGMTALDAQEGKRLWSVVTAQPMHHCSTFFRVPVITRDWIYDEPFAYQLRTGEVRKDAAGKPWQWGGYNGCGTVSASDSMLFFRNATPTMFDAGGGTGAHPLPGIRPGCYINMIAAGGLVLMPEASSGCACPFNFQTTVALMPGEGAASSGSAPGR